MLKTIVLIVLLIVDSQGYDDMDLGGCRALQKTSSKDRTLYAALVVHTERVSNLIGLELYRCKIVPRMDSRVSRVRLSSKT